METHEKMPNSDPIFPEGLTEIDIELIHAQCENQGANSKEQIEGFANAYSEAKNLVLDNENLTAITSEEFEKKLLEWAKLIESELNKNGYRQKNVAHWSGPAADWQQVPNSMKKLCEGLISFIQDPREDERFNTSSLYKHFEQIHPLEDGNGRLGDLIWKILETSKTKNWPEELPPDVFNEKK